MARLINIRNIRLELDKETLRNAYTLMYTYVVHNDSSLGEYFLLFFEESLSKSLKQKVS